MAATMTYRDLDSTINTVNAADGGVYKDSVPVAWREEAYDWQACNSEINMLDLWWEALDHLRNGDCETGFEAAQMAAADAHADSWYREQARRENEEMDRSLAIRERVWATVEAVQDATGLSFRESGGGSWYATIARSDCFVKVRISDHEQKAGGGWNEARGERMGEAHLQFVVRSAETPIPSREQIRKRLALAIRANKG
jgi:hypothetical protein